MARFEAVLWDFGGVFSASPFSAVEALGRERNLEPSRLLEAMFGPYHGDTDHPWHRLERGEIDFGSAREGIMELARADGIELDPIEVFVRMGEGSVIREEMVALAMRIKRIGHRTAIVTNNAKEFRERWVSSIPVGEICHEIVDSSEIGIRKPDPRIFQHALEILGGIAPERALFVDDYPANVEAAEALGIRGVVVSDDYENAISEIEELTR
ncbi:MAG: HAD family phosphatase [Deltaproteobacteria bacterium]|jgi:epoxide hydrolase-like predicted phosphatase|nr:HAD family phosphatase [Deltaproteobacteria bacterium]